MKSKINTKDKIIEKNPFIAPIAANSLESTQRSKYHTKGGHGFTAEDANAFVDKMEGKRVEVTGLSNELNGADRIVDGLKIQSKYYKTAQETIASAFESNNGNYRYSGQLLEVPKDQYNECVDLMSQRIKEGKVPGIKEAGQAKNVIKEGTITYKQARNIAKAGNLDSLYYDAKTESVTSGYVFAISFAVSFAHNIWAGESIEDSIKISIGNAIAAGSATLVTGVFSAQILRSKSSAISVITIREGLKVAYKTSYGRETIHLIARGSAGKAIYGGAAVNHLAKLLRSNIVTMTIVTLTTTSPDIYRVLFEKSISWNQFNKNLSTNIFSIFGGVGGWFGGAATGAAVGSVVPGLGTALGATTGALLGTVVGAIGSSVAAKKIADKYVEDDSKKLLSLLNEEIYELAFEYMLTEDEVTKVSELINKNVNPKWLRKLYKIDDSNNNHARINFIRNEFEIYFISMINKRQIIVLPSVDELNLKLDEFIERINLE